MRNNGNFQKISETLTIIFKDMVVFVQTQRLLLVHKIMNLVVTLPKLNLFLEEITL